MAVVFRAELEPPKSAVVRSGYLSKPGRLMGGVVSRYYRLHDDGRLIYWMGKPSGGEPPKGEMLIDATWHVAPASDACSFCINEARARPSVRTRLNTCKGLERRTVSACVELGTALKPVVPAL